MKRYAFASLLLAVTGVLTWIWYSGDSSMPSEHDMGMASIIGVQHLGHDYDISDFYVNGAIGGHAGREGGGGAIACCIMIPSRWRPGLTVEVRWLVGDWSHENEAETGAGNYRSVLAKEMYIARVPVEKYVNAGDIYVHFFSRGRVRVVSSAYWPLSALHPVRYGPIDGGREATVGSPIKQMFTPAELERMTKERSNAWR